MGKMTAAFLCVLILCGCASINGKLSDSEKIILIDIARYTITRQNSKFVTPREAAEINNKMPEVKIHYTGPKQGKIWLSWSLDKKKVNLIGSGELVPDRIMWQLGIAKHDYVISKEKLDPLRKRPPAGADTFADLRKTDKSTSGKRP